MMDQFASCAVLLVGDFEGDCLGFEQFRQWCGVWDWLVVSPERYVLDSKLDCSRSRFLACVRVFSDPEEKIEGDVDEVVDCLLFVVCPERCAVFAAIVAMTTGTASLGLGAGSWRR